MKRLMVIRSCTECRHLKIKDGCNSHYYSCTELKTRSSDIHSTSDQRNVHTELNEWFAKCTVWGNEEKSCATCKHWANSAYTEHEPELRECSRIKEYQDCYAFDFSIDEPAKIINVERDTLAFTFDSDMFSSGIYTRAEFFCNMYEAKG